MEVKIWIWEFLKTALENQVAFKENVGLRAGRNPFNRGEAYNGWIYEFNYKNLLIVFLDNFKGELFKKFFFYTYP